ncbi:MAG: AAA family ATPase [Byssovorax sp.]
MSDEDLLDDCAGRIATLPEPLAVLATSVEVARAEGDTTGVRKRLYDLGACIVRYGVSAGLAVLAERLAGKKAPEPLGGSLRKAARLSDGQWCELGRAIAGALRSLDPKVAKALGFISQKPLADLIASRNTFAHGGGRGEDAPARAVAVLDGAADLLGYELRSVVSLDPATFEVRRGTPIRAGVWRKVKGPIAPGAAAGEAYLLIGDAWIKTTPWLPRVESALLLPNAPHAPGKPWRSYDPDSGENREHTELTQALAGIADDGSAAPAQLSDRPAIVGRAQAITLLRRAADEAQATGVRVVLLTGPFGIGRTQLTQVVKDAAAGLGFGRVLEATCSPERRSTLRPLRRALEGVPADDRIRIAVERAVDGDILARRDGIEAALEGVEEALVETSFTEPTLLTVDDAQWADEPTLALLRLLTECAGRGARGKLLVVVTVRQEPSPSPALRRFIGMIEQDVGSGATRIELAPLPEKDAAQVVAGVGPVAPEISQALVQGAGGVPFYLVQPLLVWNETGRLSWRDRKWCPADETLFDAAVPGVGDLVWARLTSFFEPGSEAERVAHQILGCVALAGSGIAVDDAIAAMGQIGAQPAEAERGLEALLEASLLRLDETGREVRFVQALVRRSILDQLAKKPWFRRVHRALLDVIAARSQGDTDAAFLAAGYESLGDATAALPWIERGLARAFATGAFQEAIELGERLGRLARTPDERASAELSIAEALLRLGKAAEARPFAEKARGRAGASPRALVQARTLEISIASALGDPVADRDPSLCADADATGDARLSIEARLALAGALRGQAGLALADEALAHLGALAPTEARDLGYRLYSLRLELLWEGRLGDLAACRAAAARASEAAEALGSEWAVLDMEMSLSVMESDAGRSDEAVSRLGAVVEKAAARHFGTLERQARVNIAVALLRAGKAAEAAEAASRAAEAARAAGSALLAVALSIQADALLQLGRPEEAFPAIEESVRRKLAAGDANVAIALIRRAEIHAALGRAAEATADTTLALAKAEQAGNAELVARSRLWLGLDAQRRGEEGAREKLNSLVEELGPRSGSFRAVTRQLFEQARKETIPS